MFKFSVPFRSPIPVDELKSIWESRNSLVGGGTWTKKCENLMSEKFGFEDVVFTSSCTDALEMAYTLAEIGPSDNVVVPGFTFVSSVLPAINLTQDITFCDVDIHTGVMTYQQLMDCVKDNTKVVVAVNYGGINQEIDKIRDFCFDVGIFLIEDAAQSIGAKFDGAWYGSFGDVATFSFHDTKNINSGGEGGCLVINNKKYVERAHILSEKGTNRRDFLTNVVNKYEWLDKGSSHIMADFNAFLLSKNLEYEPKVTTHRSLLLSRYNSNLKHLNLQFGPEIGNEITSNGHLGYLLLQDKTTRSKFIEHMEQVGIQTAVHYPNLARSPYAKRNLSRHSLPNSDVLENRLCRLPLHFYLSVDNVDVICQHIEEWYLRIAK